MWKCALCFVVGMGIIMMGVIAADRKPEQAAERVAVRIAAALGNDPHVVLEIRSNGDGTFTPVLSPERVKMIVLRELGRFKAAAEASR